MVAKNPTELGRNRPSLDPELGRRLKQVADSIGTQKDAATLAGVSVSQFARYIKGESEPSFLTIISLCKRANVNVLWLATGEGQMHASGARETAGDHISTLDTDLLEAIIRDLESALDEEGLELAAAKKAIVVTQLYEDAVAKSDAAGRPDASSMRRLLRLVS